MKYYIYKITNLLNGKIYIGQHKEPKNPEPLNRYMGKGLAIKEAITKYGKENFSKEILEYIDDDEKHTYTSEREKYWIKTLHSLVPNGYNISPGGEGGCTKESAAKGVATKKANNYKHSEQTKQKISKALTGRTLSKEHKQHLSDNHHLKTVHIIVFEDGHEESTQDSFKTIGKRFGVNETTLIRKSAKQEFIKGIYIKNIDKNKYACCQSSIDKKMCKDPIVQDICTYQELRERKQNNIVQYKFIILKDCIIKTK